MASEQSGLAQKIITGAILLGQHANLYIWHVKLRQINMQVAPSYSKRKSTWNPYLKRSDPMHGLEITRVLKSSNFSGINISEKY